MEIEIKLNGQSLILDGWKRAGKSSHNKVRKLIPSDGLSCIVWMCTWDRVDKISYDKGHFSWTPVFLGKELKDLKKIYCNFYPDPPQFKNYQIKEAQDHMDRFLYQFNSLKVFI